MSKKKLITLGIAAGSILIFASGWCIGKRVFIEKLIREDMAEGFKEMNLSNIYGSLNRNYGSLQFEIKAECIGD